MGARLRHPAPDLRLFASQLLSAFSGEVRAEEQQASEDLGFVFVFAGSYTHLLVI